MADEDLKVRRPQIYAPRDTYIEAVQKRLHEHSKAFEGLMDLVPAEYYYGKDNSVCIDLCYRRSILNGP